MGYFMARNLAKRLPSPLLVSNRTRSKAEQLHEELGDSKIKIIDKPEDLATECDIVFTNLANDEIVKYAYEQFAAALKVCIFFQVRLNDSFNMRFRTSKTLRTRSLLKPVLCILLSQVTWS